MALCVNSACLTVPVLETSAWRGLRFRDASLPDRHCALYFATVRAHTPVLLPTVSRTSRPTSPGNAFLYSRTRWRSPACTLSRSAHNESLKISEQERYLSLLRKTPSSQNQPVPLNPKARSCCSTDENENNLK
ncbi:hypothetical protein IscW_ISCW001627 [Ixodes scapularis]|uniref:Uncharacterized protein n=1 Tax=Ixodes scapularis TaxID=6945 RepID=B7P2Y8_IXOSC|nr:hypothetical protein IscW_ISCW001627 [Ixodes scapularis]|eukprot:XP_002403160.1 hypothetical protein IscW_ISCW001627 [Ixodes scapularis]